MLLPTCRLLSSSILLLTHGLGLGIGLTQAQLHPTEPSQYQRLPPLRERARLQDAWRAERLANIPALLEKYEVDAWLMSQREYAEDTVWWSMKQATEFSPHRRTVVLFHTNTSSLAGQPNPLTWVDNTGSVWPELLSVLSSFDPQRIAINTHDTIAFAGGLHVGEMEDLKVRLGEKWMERTVNVPMLPVEFIAARVPGQLVWYKKMMESVWAMVEEAFSERVIEPGVTTTVDLEWWFREKYQALNATTWFHPSVSVVTAVTGPGWSGTGTTIQEGDMLHVDFGITVLGLNTDTQHLGYVLRTSQGETGVPESMKEGLRKSNRMQDILLEMMEPGLLGDDILKKSLMKMQEEGIEGKIYSHPIGDWGHSAGTVMGFTNLQEHVPVLGELPLLPNTYYSIELYASHFVPEKGGDLVFMQEEDVYWVDEKRGWEFVRGRQERFHLVNWTAPSVSHRPVLLVQKDAH